MVGGRRCYSDIEITTQPGSGQRPPTTFFPHLTPNFLFWQWFDVNCGRDAAKFLFEAALDLLGDCVRQDVVMLFIRGDVQVLYTKR